MLALCAGGTRRSGPLYSFFPSNLRFVDILKRTTFESNRMFVPLFMSIMIIQNVGPFVGEVQGGVG